MKVQNAHGGSLAVGRRRSRRPLSTKHPIHITFKSDLAKGPRSLMKHQKMIEAVVYKWAKRFHISVYQKAVAGNHIHLLVRGKTRVKIQNFFRVVSGQIAQEILRHSPIAPDSHNQSSNAQNLTSTRAPTCLKNRRTFWSFLIYSRLLTCWREFKTVSKYIIQNKLEALNLVAYRPRKIRPRIGNTG